MNFLKKIKQNYESYSRRMIDDAEYYFYRGKEKEQYNDYKGAIEDYNTVLEIEPLSVETLLTRGNAKDSLKDFHGALLDFDKAIELQPADINTLFTLKQIYARTNKPDKVKAVQEKINAAQKK